MTFTIVDGENLGWSHMSKIKTILKILWRDTNIKINLWKIYVNHEY